MKRSNLVVIVSTTLMSLFFMTRLTFSCDNIFPCSGNVGIGTTNPGGILHTRAPSVASNILDTSTSGGQVNLQFADNGTNKWAIYKTTVNDLAIYDYAAYGNRMVIKASTGNVGIGTSSPVQKLHIHNSSTSNYSEAATIYTNADSGTTNNDGFYVGMNSYGACNAWVWNRENTSIIFGTNGTYRMRILGNGNVGIGTSTPDYKLDVNGTIRAKEVLVATGWSDFVFDDNYNLPSLAHVESYIEENNHLPDIPSAKEIQENGVSMAEMIGKQMQKIEELTLYVIEQNKQINELKDELAELKKTN